MAELTIRPDEIRAALDSFVKSYEPAKVITEEVGRVSLAGDGIAQVEGLPSAMANELLQFEDGTLGLALSLDVREIGVVILGESAAPGRFSPLVLVTTTSVALLTHSVTQSMVSAKSRPLVVVHWSSRHRALCSVSRFTNRCRPV
jgi:hypothetical protein